MIPGETIFRSPLDKPLGLLTEDDISQVTREDCRRYLKEKGMRRPSWNKSQAIEQVISLKSLLETRTESDAVGGEGLLQRQRIITVPPQPEIEIPIQVSSNTEIESVPSTEKVKATSANLQVSVSVNDESVSFRRKDPSKSGISGDLSYHPPISDTNPTSLRNMRATTGSVGQMTIFYCGEVNVYDDMSADKARFIMQLAASPTDSPQDTPLVGTSVVQPLPWRLQGLSSFAVSPTLQSGFGCDFTAVPDNSRQYWEEGATFREAEPEGPTNRKASVQRYLEKRKDRGKFKIKKKIGCSSSNLEMYLNHQLRGQNSNEHSSPSGTCSPPQPRLPHTPIGCNSLENQADNMSLSVDLNSNEVLEV